jgi:hypothetical protein
MVHLQHCAAGKVHLQPPQIVLRMTVLMLRNSTLPCFRPYLQGTTLSKGIEVQLQLRL